MSFFLHEQIYRDLGPIAERQITIGGAGAIGANLAECLARMGLRRLRVIDRDRVAAHNLSTQPWVQQDIGAPKARALASALYRAVGARLDARHVELDERNAAELIAGSALVVDAFDNPPARLAIGATAAAAGIPCLHLALGPGGDYGCGLWDAAYKLPAGAVLAHGDACDYPLTRPLALIVAAAGAEAAVEFLRANIRRGFELTLRDLQLTPLAGPG